MEILARLVKEAGFVDKATWKLKRIMKKDDWRRLWMHTPWGALAAFVYTQDPLAGVTILAIELIYEAFNDWRKRDWSYKDVLGIVWGFMIPIFVWRLYLWIQLPQ